MDVDDHEKARHRNPSPKEPFAALAFKLIHDPYVGQQTFVRVYSGSLRSGMQLMNSTKGKPERIGRILKIRAKDREEVSEAGPGDIVALIGLKYTKTGDTLCDMEQQLHLESIHIPPSVIELKINPASRKDQSILGEALSKLVNEDPSFHARLMKKQKKPLSQGWVSFTSKSSLTG